DPEHAQNPTQIDRRTARTISTRSAVPHTVLCHWIRHRACYSSHHKLRLISPVNLSQKPPTCLPSGSLPTGTRRRPCYISPKQRQRGAPHYPVRSPKYGIAQSRSLTPCRLLGLRARWSEHTLGCANRSPPRFVGS